MAAAVAMAKLLFTVLLLSLKAVVISCGDLGFRSSSDF